MGHVHLEGMPTQAAHAFGKYLLLQRIAAGGMAEIFKARFQVAGGQKTCVIKRILPHLAMNDDFITMFHDEARISVRLSHANIVQVFDFGNIEGDHFLAMEYVQGQNLGSLLKKLRKTGDTLPVPIALYIAAETAKGLHYAHSRADENGQPLGIVHRDVSPANILLSYEGEVKIADFGIAKAASKDAATKTGHIKGKASYLAPEQLLSKQLDARCDVFAMGAVLWEMLAGHKLFSGENELEIIAKVSRIKIEPPSSVNTTLPRELDGVVMKALQRNLRNRFQNAGELYRALMAVIRHFGIDVTSTEVGSYIKNVFTDELQAELEAERELSKSFANLDLEAVRKGAEQESTAVDHRAPKGRSETIGSRTLPRPRRGLAVMALAGGLFIALAAGVWVAPDVGVDVPFELLPPPSVLFGSADQVDGSKTATTAVAAADTPVPTGTATPVAKQTPKRRNNRRNNTRTTPKPTQTVEAAATPTPAPVPSEYGVLSIDSQPWGEIYIDGKKIGRQTPAFNMKVPVGKHRIKLVNPVVHAEAAFTVTITKDKPVVKNLRLQKSDVVKTDATDGT